MVYTTVLRSVVIIIVVVVVVVVEMSIIKVALSHSKNISFFSVFRPTLLDAIGTNDVTTIDKPQQ